MEQDWGRVLSFDFEYQVCRRIFVVGPDRQYQKPFKSLCTIFTEKAKVIWWGAFAHKEGMDEILLHLKELQERFIHLGKNLNVLIYVDNCCKWYKKIKDAWPECFVKLDSFHWMNRFKELLANPNSPEAHIFRRLLSRAVHVVPDDEIERVRDELWDSGNFKRYGNKDGIPIKMILGKCNTFIPEPKELEENVRKVLHFIRLSDEAKSTFNQHLRPDESQRKLNRTFVSDTNKIDSVVVKLMEYVKKGCLSYPGEWMEEEFARVSDIAMHQMNIKHKTFSKQGTSNTEALNSVNQR
jgi:hypothetical protein